MKKTYLMMLAVITMCIAACGNGGKIKPASKKVNGPLGKYFEIVDREYKVDGETLSVEFMRIAEGGPSDASWTSCPTFTVELQDEDGNLISSNSTDVVLSEAQLESVFSLGVEETASISFKFDKTKGASKFKVSSKWDKGDESSDEPEEVYTQKGNDGAHDMRGRVDKYPVTMHLDIDGTQVKGSYYYDAQGSNSQLFLSGSCDDDMLDLNETNSEGMPTGHFMGYLRDGVFRGQFISYQGKSMNFAVTEGDVNDLTFDDSSSDDSYDDSYIGSSSESSDWDELLDSYEQYVDDYISLLKKAKSGDVSALSEYASVFDDANELSDKLQNAKSEMSASQLSRYNKITMKMAKAAQELQ